MTELLDHTEPSAPTDDVRRDALVDRLFNAFINGSELLTIELGRRLGLYEAMQVGAATAAELAQRSGIAPRYAREWLEQQAAAGFLDVAQDTTDADARQYVLPTGFADVLIDADHPSNVVAFAPFLTGFALTLPAVAKAYQTGSGVAYEEFGAEVRHGIGLGNRPMFVNEMAGWINALPDVAGRLRSGGTVLDVACGIGYSSEAMAGTFPRIRVEGIDMDTASIAEARALATRAGLADRVRFSVGNASDPSKLPTCDEGFELVTIFEALHDMGDPIATMAAVRPLLRSGGAVLIADERVSDDFSAPAGDVDRLMYAASVLHCLPATMAEATHTANGTVLRASTVRKWATAAGFTVTELPIENLLWRFYRLDPID